jgi:4-amino-4-deoxy-L-arabinose transferase-like glycosyltransferase
VAANLARYANRLLFFNGQEAKAQLRGGENVFTLSRMTTMSVTLPQEGSAARGDTASYRVLYVLLFTIGFALRFAMVLWRKSYIFPPFWIFENISIATHLVTGHGFSSPFNLDTGPTAWIAPGYPFFIATVFRIFGVYSAVSMGVIFGVQCLMAGGTGIAIHALAKRTVGAAIGWWAAWIWTLSPFFFRWPTTWIWDFTASALLMALLLILTLDVGETGRTKLWVELGGLWGLTALTNPALLSVLPITLAYAGYVNRKASRKWLPGLSLASVLFVAIIAPWLIRNEIVFGHPVFLRSNYWFEFHLGNYHYSNGMGFSGKHPTQNPLEMRKYMAMGEQGYIEWAKKDALQFVREYPGEFWNLTVHRVWWFWDGTTLIYEKNSWWKPWEFWPLSLTGWLGLLFVLTRRPRGWVLLTAPLIFYPAPYYLSYGVSKYRHAVEPELVLLSVYLAYVLWREINQRVVVWRRRSAKRREAEASA